MSSFPPPVNPDLIPEWLRTPESRAELEAGIAELIDDPNPEP